MLVLATRSEHETKARQERTSEGEGMAGEWVAYVAGRPLVVALDGTAASGKGTVGRKIAEHYGMKYLDTGAIYRALAYIILEQGGNPALEADALQAALALSAGREVSRDMLYCEGVGAAASVASAFPSVRQELLEYQRQFARASGGAVLDGRDIGTVICPDAQIKIYMTADLEARAMRRFKQLREGDSTVIYGTILEDLRSRDARDSERKVAPLKKAEDAVAVDTTLMEPAEVLDRILRLIDEQLDQPKARHR